MKSKIFIKSRLVAAWGGGVISSAPQAYVEITEEGSGYKINNVEKVYTAAELRCIRECIDRLLPKNRKNK